MRPQRVQQVGRAGPGAARGEAPAAGAARVALTGFGGPDAAGAAVARALRQGWPGELSITALGRDPVMPGAWQPGLVDRLRHVPPESGAEDLARAVLRAHDEAPFDALVPSEDLEVLSVARMAQRLAETGIRTLVPSLDRLEAVRRENLPKFLYDNRLPAPLTAVVTDPADVARQADQVGYPLLVLGAFGGEALAYDATQATRAAARLCAATDDRVLLQRHLTGDRYAVAMVADAVGACVGAVARRSLAVNGDGRTVCGAVVDDPGILGTARKVLEALEWRGPLEVELVRPAGDGQAHVCALNWRLPSWTMLCHWAGANLAVLLLERILGGATTANPRARAGVMSVSGVAEHAVPARDLFGLGRHGTARGRAPVNGADRGPDKGAEPTSGLCVALTGVSTFDVVNPGLGVARALRRAPGVARIYGLAYGTFDSGAYQPELLDAAFRLSANAAGRGLVRELRAINETHPIDVLIPCLDGELPRFIEIADALGELNIRTLLPAPEGFERRSKLHLFGGATDPDWGAFRIPESLVAQSESETRRALGRIGVPAVVKGPLSHCIPVADEAAAGAAWWELHGAGAEAVIVQQAIAGPCYAVSTVCDRGHRALSSLTIKKLAVCERGSTWSALRVEQPALEAAFETFLRSIGWVGPAEGEFIRDALTDRFYLIEVNPRFTAWIYFSAALGINQPYLAARTALGERVNPAAPEGDLVFLRSREEVALPASRFAALSTKGVLLHG